MKKCCPPASISTRQGATKAPAETIWCVHYECYKYIRVCDRCRVRIKCANYQDYWAPRFDFFET